MNQNSTNSLDALPYVSNIFPSYQKGNVKLINADCMEIMAQYPDKYFDWVITDPEYGINKDGTIGFATKKTKGFTFTKKEYTQKDWDKRTPEKKYFDEVFRVSKNQIIWGANYFIDKLPHLKNFICWYKKGLSKDDKFNECEIAFVSCGRSIMIDIWWNGFGTINSGENRIHPTQKPLKLYNRLLDIYCSKDMKILDTHGGSFNSAISAYYFGISEFVGTEIDAEYFEKSIKRFEVETMQQVLSL